MNEDWSFRASKGDNFVRLKANSHHTGRCWPTATETSIRFDILSSGDCLHLSVQQELILTDWNLSCFYSQTTDIIPSCPWKSRYVVFMNESLFWTRNLELSVSQLIWMICSWFRLIQFSSSTHLLNNLQQITAHLKTLALMVPWKIIPFAQKVL